MSPIEKASPGDRDNGLCHERRYVASVQKVWYRIKSQVPAISVRAVPMVGEAPAAGRRAVVDVIVLED